MPAYMGWAGYVGGVMGPYCTGRWLTMPGAPIAIETLPNRGECVLEIVPDAGRGA